MKLPDAIQLATSIHADCYALISHDRDFEKSSEILVLG
jgi:predicted nucleic acid-binding protein